MPSISDNEASERSPLLSNHAHTANVHVVESSENQRRHDDSEENGDDGTAIANEPTTAKKTAILCSMFVGVFFAALDTTIVATLSAPISSSFNSLTLLSWLATGYLIANSACQPLSGKLTDIFSRRTGLVFSNTFFAVGTLICGLAPNAGTIIAGRIVAGIGGGGLTCISTFVISDLIPLRKRGLWQGFGNLVFGLGMGLGGITGGVCADRLHIVIRGTLVAGWRWSFLLQLPFIIVSAVLVHLLVDIPVNPSNRPALRRVDFLGSLFLVLTVVLLLLGLNTGGNQLPWSNPLIIASLVASLLSLLTFIYLESSCPRLIPEPIIPVKVIARSRTILAACLTNWFATMSAFLALYYVPLYLQAVLQASTQSAGLRTIPFAVATSAGSLGCGFIMRATGRYYILNAANTAIFAVGTALLCVFDTNTPAYWTYLFVVPIGLGYGSMITITLVAMISAAEHKYQATVTAASYAFRSTGSTIGITIAGVVFQNLLTAKLRDEYGALPGAEKDIRKIRDSLDGLRGVLPPGWDRETVLGIYMQSLRGAFLSGLVLALLATLCGLMMKEHFLHRKLDRRVSDAGVQEQQRQHD